MYKFNWKNVPDSSKLKENDKDDLSSYNKFHIDYEKAYDITMDPTINVSMEEINSLNIVINDNECGNSLIEQLCEQLLKKGLSFSFSRNEDNISPEHSVVITLDQQYISGPKTIIIAPYSNERVDFSDALALSFFTEFISQNIETEGICCGKRGFRQNEGEISTRIPTPTEDAISSESNTSFVTIAFGTNLCSVEEMSTAIINSLARYVHYLSYLDYADLIYCAKNGDTIDSIAEIFNTTAFDLSNFNNFDMKIPVDEAVINPNINNFATFNKNNSVTISDTQKISK